MPVRYTKVGWVLQVWPLPVFCLCITLPLGLHSWQDTTMPPPNAGEKVLSIRASQSHRRSPPATIGMIGPWTFWLPRLLGVKTLRFTFHAGSRISQAPVVVTCLSFPASVPTFLLVCPGITSKIVYLPLNTCLGICFWGDPSWDDMNCSEQGTLQRATKEKKLIAIDGVIMQVENCISYEFMIHLTASSSLCHLRSPVS